MHAFLAGHEEDRLAANQHYQNAEENALTRGAEREQRGQRRVGSADRAVPGFSRPGPFGEAGSGGHSPGTPGRGRDRGGLADHAEGRTYFSMGVTLNTGGRVAGLRGRAPYRSQKYEQSIRTAAAAIQQIRQANSVAAQQAFWRQMQVDSNRHRYPSGPIPGRGISLETPRSPRPRRPPARLTWVVPPRPSRSRNPRQATTLPHPRSKPKASPPRREAHGPASPPRAGGKSTRTASRRRAYTHCRVEKPPAIHYHVR